MKYFDPVSSHIKRNGGDSALIAAVRDYLENTHPHDEPPWCVEFDDICQAAVAYANAKKERLRKHKKRTAVAKAKSPAAARQRGHLSGRISFYWLSQKVFPSRPRANSPD